MIADGVTRIDFSDAPADDTLYITELPDAARWHIDWERGRMYVVQSIDRSKLGWVYGIPNTPQNIPFVTDEQCIGTRGVCVMEDYSSGSGVLELVFSDGKHYAVTAETVELESAFKARHAYTYIRRHFGLEYMTGHATYEDAMALVSKNINTDDDSFDDCNPVELWHGGHLCLRSEIVPYVLNYRALLFALRRFEQARGDQPKEWWGALS